MILNVNQLSKTYTKFINGSITSKFHRFELRCSYHSCKYYCTTAYYSSFVILGIYLVYYLVYYVVSGKPSILGFSDFVSITYNLVY